MTNTPTPEALAVKLEALNNAATPGPWQQNGSHFYGPEPDRELIGQFIGKQPASDWNLIQALRNNLPAILDAFRATPAPVYVEAAFREGHSKGRVWRTYLDEDEDWKSSDALAAIAAMPQTAEIARLEAENAMMSEALAKMANTINIVGSDYDQAVQALDRLVHSVKTQARQALKGPNDETA